MRTIHAESPAKLNLGLEITGRRVDGFHDLVSIFQAITLADRLSVHAPVTETTLRVHWQDQDDPDLVPGNLVSKAVDLLAAETGMTVPTSIALAKRIPRASGLGGASSNAATALRALVSLWDAPVADHELMRMAAQLGSDVPFFLSGGTALVTGAGERIEPLPSLPSGWYVLLTPRLQRPIARKTATLYSALTKRDFTSGEAVGVQSKTIRAGNPLDPSLLPNPFQRHVLTLRPEIQPMLDTFVSAGAPFTAMSGAGPTHYTYVHRRDQAERIAERVRSSLGTRADLVIATGSPGLIPLEKQGSVA